MGFFMNTEESTLSNRYTMISVTINTTLPDISGHNNQQLVLIIDAVICAEKELVINITNLDEMM